MHDGVVAKAKWEAEQVELNAFLQMDIARWTDKSQKNKIKVGAVPVVLYLESPKCKHIWFSFRKSSFLLKSRNIYIHMYMY